MAKTVLLDAFVMINTTDVSDHVSKIEVDDTFEEKDVTTFGSSGAKEVLAGLESGSVAITFKNDFASGQLDEFMWGLRRTLATVTVRPSQDAVSTSNPEYSTSALINSWKPISASPGDVAEVDVTFPISGGWSRTTGT